LRKELLYLKNIIFFVILTYEIEIFYELLTDLLTGVDNILKIDEKI